MNDLDLCLESYINQGHVNHIVTFDVEYLVRERDLVPKDHQQEMACPVKNRSRDHLIPLGLGLFIPLGYQMVT